MRCLVAVLAFLLLLPVAQGASFDCGKASGANEKAICADPGLSQADDVMALAYVGAVAGLTEEAEIVMRQGQRDWLAFSDKVCADAYLPGEDRVAVERGQCLQRLYDARFIVLEQSRMVGGRRFFTVDRYQALPDPDGGRFKVGLKVVSSLRLDGNDSLADAFNAYMRQVTDRYTGRYTDFAGTTMDDTVPHEDNDFLMTLEGVNAKRISVGLALQWYGHGGAHANSSYGNFHFLREEERPLEASDLFEGKGWTEALADLVAERASADLGGGDLSFDSQTVLAPATDPQRWSFGPAGLVVQFQDQEILPGSPVVNVSWGALRDHLTEGSSDIIGR